MFFFFKLGHKGILANGALGYSAMNIHVKASKRWLFPSSEIKSKDTALLELIWKEVDCNYYFHLSGKCFYSVKEPWKNAENNLCQFQGWIMLPYQFYTNIIQLLAITPDIHCWHWSNSTQ